MNGKEEIILKTRDYLITNQFEEAISYFQKNLGKNDKQLSNELHLISSRLNSLNTNERHNLLSITEINIERNKISKAILDLLTNFEVGNSKDKMYKRVNEIFSSPQISENIRIKGKYIAGRDMNINQKRKSFWSIVLHFLKK